MKATLKQATARHLAEKAFRTDNEMYVYLISLAAIWYCVFAHAYMLILYLFHGETFFSGFNVFSLCVYAITLLVHRRGKYAAATCILFFEVCFFAGVEIVLGGIQNHATGYFLLVIVLQIILPYASVRFQTGVVMGVLLWAGVSVFVALQATHVLPGTWQGNALMVSNMVILFAGTIVQLCIGNVVNTVIKNVQDVKINELTLQAHTDALTKLFNRRHAEAFFASPEGMDEKKRYCVAMLDIDDFKLVNDSYGHDCGDIVLQYLASFLKENLRESDRVFRWGGEEFMVILADVELTTAHAILNKLREKLAKEEILAMGHSLHITATVGLSMVADGAWAEAIRQSDNHMYKGKAQGKNCVIFQ